MRKYGIGQGKDGAVIPSPVGVFADQAMVAPPDPPNNEVSRGGVEPLMTFAAKWFNFFQNYYTRNWNEAALDVEDLYFELQNVLEAAGITPDGTLKTQLLEAIQAIIDDRTRDVSFKEVTFTTAANVVALTPTNNQTLSSLFSIIGGWYRKLVSKDGNLFEVTFNNQDSFNQLTSGSALQDLFGRLTGWYDFIKKPNNAVLDGIRESRLFEPLRDNDTLQVIAGKLNKWFYNIAMVHATGLVPVLAEPPADTPAEGYGYLWVDPFLKKLRCRAMIDGQLINVFTESAAGGGGDNVRPLEVVFLTENVYSNAWGKDVPAGPDSDYADGGRPTMPGGFHWVDPIDYNFDHVEFVEPNGTKTQVMNGVQHYFPPPGLHTYIIKTVDTEGFASIGIEVPETEYFNDCNVFIADAQTSGGEGLQGATEFYVWLTDAIDVTGLVANQPVSGVTASVAGVSCNPLFMDWDPDTYKITFKVPFTSGTRTNLITSTSTVFLNIAAGSGLKKIDGASMIAPPPNVPVTVNSEYVYPVIQDAYVTQDEVRQLNLQFNKVLTATTQGWNISGSSNSLSVIQVIANNDTEITLLLNKPVIQTDTLTLNFGGNNSVDNIGFPMKSFTASITNNSDYLPVNVVSAQIPSGQPATLMLVFSASATLPNIYGWSLTNTAANIASIISTNDTVALIQLDSPVLETDGPQVSYNAVTGQSVDYESQPIPTQAPLDVANNAHDTSGDVLDANISSSEPNVISLYMSEAVQLFDFTGFTFTRNGSALNNADFEGLTVTEFKVDFTYPWYFDTGDTVSIAYDGTGNLLDLSGGQIPAFTKVVNNHSTRTGLVPVSASIIEVTNADGVDEEWVEITFNGDVDAVYDEAGLTLPYAYPIVETYPNPMDSYSAVLNPDGWKDVIKYELSNTLNLYNYLGVN